MAANQPEKIYSLDELAKFLVKAKTNTYAAGKKEKIKHVLREVEFCEEKWGYKDSYIGFDRTPGHGVEMVRYSGLPVWMLSYHGGMLPEYQKDNALREETFSFLKKALLLVNESKPFRGPNLYAPQGSVLTYVSSSEGDIKNFKGQEAIWNVEKEIYTLNYIGGIVLPEEIID